MTENPKRVRKAVLPAAGLGTRFLPATKAQPKEMLPVVDKPLIQYVVEECVASGIENIIIVTGRGKNAIEDHFDSSPELESFLESKGKSALARARRARGERFGGKRTVRRPTWRCDHFGGAARDAAIGRGLRGHRHRRYHRRGSATRKDRAVWHRGRRTGQRFALGQTAHEDSRPR